jgi:CobQ/CobB/MinD/ParA nucleotide binding domain
MDTILTFEKIKHQIIDEVQQLSDVLSVADEIYIVCNIYSRFTIYVLSEKAQIITALKNKDNLKLERIEKIEKDGFIHKDLQKQRKNLDEIKGIYYVDRHIDKLNWFLNSDQHYTSKSPIVCFYSFKGGLGRTTAMVTSGIALARMGYKVAMLDFDLEAPGLSTLFSNDMEQALEARGIVDFLVDVSSLNNNMDNLRLSDYYFTVNKQDVIGTNGGELLIFPAICEKNETEDIGYISKLSKINLLFQNQQPFLPDLLLDKIQSELNPDIILIDTRTGINEIGGLFLSRYADMSFLFFFGNKQNMFGLKSILGEFSQFKSKIYLVNSPVPKHPLGQEVKEFYLQSAYDIFSEQVYEEGDAPFINDETAPHYPIEVPFNDLAIIADRIDNLKGILEERGGENPYLKMAETMKTIISKGIVQKPNLLDKPTNEASYKELLFAFRDIAPEGTAASEYEISENISDWFYPRKDYKFIFDKSKFLILGEKGAGKTALYAVLSNKEYASNLATYLSRNNVVESNEFTNTEWIKAMDKTENYPSRSVFEEMLNDTLSDHGTMIRFWKWLMIRYTPENYLPPKEEFKQILAIARSKSFKDIVIASEQRTYSIALDEVINEINAKLKNEQKYFTYIYDYLDRELPEENDLRGKLISGLIDMWYSYSSRLSQIRAKIFLRKDIFEREVFFTDKVKVNNNSAEITWEYDQLLNVIWKRALHTRHELPNIYKKYFENGNIQNSDTLGKIPELNEESNRKLLSELLGEYMGSNNKAFPYNWVIYHASDAHKRIQPRSILNLFSKSASQQLEENDVFTETPLRPKYMELVMSEVSTNRVTDIKEEYPTLKFVFDNISTLIQQFPVEEGKLNEVLKALIEKGNLTLTSDEIKTKLIDIGVLYEYKSTRKGTEKKYHIPDLYLFGMGLRRKGPGAHKVLFKRK